MTRDFTLPSCQLINCQTNCQLKHNWEVEQKKRIGFRSWEIWQLLLLLIKLCLNSTFNFLFSLTITERQAIPHHVDASGRTRPPHSIVHWRSSQKGTPTPSNSIESFGTLQKRLNSIGNGVFWRVWWFFLRIKVKKHDFGLGSWIAELYTRCKVQE